MKTNKKLSVGINNLNQLNFQHNLKGDSIRKIEMRKKLNKRTENQFHHSQIIKLKIKEIYQFQILYKKKLKFDKY